MMNSKFGNLLSLAVVTAFSNVAVANTVFMNFFEPGLTSLVCGDSGDNCEGFTGSPGLSGSGDAQLSLTMADEQAVTPNANPDSELAWLNTLITSLDPAGTTLSEVRNRDNTQQTTQTIYSEYFAVKQSTETFFFKNLTGGALEISLIRENDQGGTEDPANWSHTTEFGAEVPIPAAAWLFGTALVGLVGIGRKKRAN